MKYLYIVLLILPTFLSSQSIVIEGATQIDAREVVVGSYPSDDELLVFINHDTDLTLEDSTYSSIGGYDISIAILEGGYLDYGLSLATTGSEKWYSFEVLGEATDSAYFVAQFQDSLKIQFEDEDDDSDVWQNSSYPYPVGIMMSDENSILWRSYLGYADTSTIITTTHKGNLYMAGLFADSLYYESPNGSVSKHYVAAFEQAMFLAKINNYGTMDWIEMIDGGNFANVANLAMIDSDVSLLYNNIAGSTMVQYDESGTLVRTAEWNNCVLVHSQYELGNLYLSGWVDTDQEHNLDVTGGTVTLPAGNDTDGVLLSYDSDLNLNWVQNIAGTNRSHIINFDIAGVQEAIYVTGHVRGQSLLGDDIVLIAADDDHDLLIAKYTLDGSPLWAEVYTGEGNDSGRYIHIAEEQDDQVQVHVVATFTGDLTLPIDFFEETFVDNFESSPLSWVALTFEEDFDSSTPDIEEEVLLLSPNPTQTYLEVGGSTTSTSTYAITNVNGVTHHLVAKDGRLDVSALLPGVYTVTMADGSKLYSSTFVKI